LFLLSFCDANIIIGGTTGGFQFLKFQISLASLGNGVYASVTGTNGKDYKFCTIGGGWTNTASNAASTVGGGLGNNSGGYASTVAGGHSNTTLDFYSTATGGYKNKASGYGSTIDGGLENTASGHSSTVSGGYKNIAAGNYSWAGGKHMQLTVSAYDTFVWGHSENAQSISTANAFLVFPAGTPGKVGVGTANPRHLLDLGHTLGKKLAVYQGPDGNSFYGFGISSNTLEIYAGADVADEPAMVVKKSTGRVGIGTTDPGYLLEVNGSAAKPGGGVWSVSSDERLKDITGGYESGLDEIMQLRSVKFYYKDSNPRGLPRDEEYVGFIAQEVQEVFPEAVTEGPDGYLDFNMHPVNVAVVNAIKELKTENDEVRSENEYLRVENAMLKKDIEKIKVILGI
jgi:hypothetical protein